MKVPGSASSRPVVWRSLTASSIELSIIAFSTLHSFSAEVSSTTLSFTR